MAHARQRQEVFEGKGRIAADLYAEIIKIRPPWHNDDLRKSVIKVVMTSTSSDGPAISRHYTTKEQRRVLAERMKNPEDELRLVIVIKALIKKNLIQGKSLMEMLENSIKKYHNKILSASEVIEELIKLSKEIKEMDKAPHEMGLSDFEYAFYTAIANNESARQVMEKAKYSIQCQYDHRALRLTLAHQY